MLPEQRLPVKAVEGDAVGDLDEVELALLRQDVVDVRGQEGVGVEDAGADGALDGGFDFGFGSGNEAVEGRRRW